MSTPMSFAEIAREMGISKSRAESIFNHAIRKIRAAGAKAVARSYLADSDQRRQYATPTIPRRYPGAD